MMCVRCVAMKHNEEDVREYPTTILFYYQVKLYRVRQSAPCEQRSNQ